MLFEPPLEWRYHPNNEIGLPSSLSALIQALTGRTDLKRLTENCLVEALADYQPSARYLPQTSHKKEDARASTLYTMRLFSVDLFVP